MQDGTLGTVAVVVTVCFACPNVILSFVAILLVHFVDGTEHPQKRRERRAEARDDGDSWREWYCLTPLERWHESMKLREFHLPARGSLDPEPDHQNPFDAFLPRGLAPAYGRSGLRVLRRGRVESRLRYCDRGVYSHAPKRLQIRKIYLDPWSQKPGSTSVFKLSLKHANRIYRRFCRCRPAFPRCSLAMIR